MTRLTVDGVPVIEAETAQRCDFCLRSAETRPYGPDGREICHDCMMATPQRQAEAKRRFNQFLDRGGVRSIRGKD